MDPEKKPLSDKKILLGVSGGIAAYKAPALVRRLRDAGAEVRVVLTGGGSAFVTPMSLQAVSGHRVREALLDVEAEAGMGHIELARWADVVLIAPASAGLIGRLAAGLADDLLSTLVLATQAPVWLAPAMNRVMWANPAVTANCRLLSERGLHLIEPDDGSQACGETGAGRMPEPEALVAILSATAKRFAGQRFVITAGPTHEPLDPVRFLGNRSSGRMGFALAGALAAAGAAVELVSGPVRLATPAGVDRVDVTTAEQMRAAVMDRIAGASGFIGVAAVADYRPEALAEHKIKKSGQALTMRLVPNPDILAEVASHSRRPPFVMGFAAETRDLAEAARAKLVAKGLDLIAGNEVGEAQGFDRPDNALTVIARDREWQLGHQSKIALAAQLVDIIAQLTASREERSA